MARLNAAAPAPPTSRRPKDGDFLQQRMKVRGDRGVAPPSFRCSPPSLPPTRPTRLCHAAPQAYQPIITPRSAIILFLVLAVPFIALGFAIKAASDGVVELSIQYDGTGYAAPSTGVCALDSTKPGVQSQCELTFTAPSAMAAPVFVYYELDNFYQNHRRYVASKSDVQLAGTIYTSSSDTNIATCSPSITSASGKVLHPCGLIANSFFNGAQDGPAKWTGRLAQT